MGAVHFDSYSEARGHLKDLLDAAEHGRVATVRRHSVRTAMVDVERLRGYLPADLVHLLVTKAGVDESEIVGMTKEEAVALIQRYWTGQ